MRLICFLFLFTSTIAKAQPAFQWPEGKKAAVVLTYDDALLSQLNIAIPQLDSFTFKGTFFLTAGMTDNDLLRWRMAAGNGHELGNHTIYHPCAGNNTKANAHYAAENYDVNSIIKEISIMNKLLYAIDNKRRRTYAYPCTETAVGGVDYTDSLRRSQLITYARIGGDSNAVITNFKQLDKLLVPSWGFGNHPSGEALIHFAEKATEAGGLAIFMFHGVGGDYLDVTSNNHRQLLQYLAAHKEIWVATFSEVMDYISATIK